ncbi:MAG: glycosyltransferase [Candidatus Aminicenantes bacterium]|nr:glycosyltransferase [Candidatus Aminicenantes bacterium]NIM77603.1 glycosyltransferase [Candidatus Aminicenantes bacterium]NIN16917.1 glycosyltransferase [Candidatus Aminicenantes bacterium]NIN40810.1 glycosyltransferase [Candidatus Aminicenantes bacterium]NIN83614.1 glycosyltransferase [Candidatus Aminicenantes bacterium]
MNILIINTSDIMGGAARAAYRLHKGLNRIGINSLMLTKIMKSQDERVLQANLPVDDDSSIELEIIDLITKNYIKNNRTNLSNTFYSLGYPGYDLASMKIMDRVDLINLHWVAGFQSTESISSLLKLGKPVVWTLHDQNPFTGGCHYSAGCTLYESDCNTCPQLANDPYNFSYYNLKNKVTHFQDKNITIVSPSQWLANLARHSMVFRNSNVVTIPNSIEINVFTPQNKGTAKRKLGIAESCLTVLTGASGWREKRKGFSEFLSTMRYCLKNKKFKSLVDAGELLLLCFGTPANEMDRLKIPYQSFGHVHSDEKLCDIYNAADIFVFPSVEDNLPNTILEAMACATPVIAFNTGGMPDMINDGGTGRLVPFRDVEKLAAALLDLIFNAGVRNQIGKRSRKLMENNYKLEDQAQNYAGLFYKLLPRGTTSHSTSKNFTLHEDQYCSLDLSFNTMLLPLYRKYADTLHKRKR